MARRRGPAARPDGRAGAAARDRQTGPGICPGELTRLERACAGRSFAQRRDTATIAALTATDIRLSELAGLRCGDLDLWQREITVRGKGGKDRIVRIGHQAARRLDRYLRARSRHAQAHRPQLWLSAGNREPAVSRWRMRSDNSPGSSGTSFIQGTHPGRPRDASACTNCQRAVPVEPVRISEVRRLR